MVERQMLLLLVIRRFAWSTIKQVEGETQAIYEGKNIIGMKTDNNKKVKGAESEHAHNVYIKCMLGEQKRIKKKT